MALRIRISNSDAQQTHVLLSGEVDLATVQDLKATLEGVVHGAAKQVVLDLSEVTYLGSCGVSVIIKALDELEAQEGTLRITGAHGPVRVVLQMLGLTYLIRDTGSPHCRKMTVNKNPLKR